MMNDAMCLSEASLGDCETNSDRPSATSDSCVPIWKRHILPLTPTTSNDPFEFTCNPSPTLRRVKSKTKMNRHTVTKTDKSEEGLLDISSPRKKARLPLTANSSSDSAPARVAEPDLRVCVPRSNPMKKFLSSSGVIGVIDPISTRERKERCISLPAPSRVASAVVRKRSNSIGSEEIGIRRSTLPEKCDDGESVLISTASLPSVNSQSTSLSCREIMDIMCRASETSTLELADSNAHQHSFPNHRCETSTFISFSTVNSPELSSEPNSLKVVSPLYMPAEIKGETCSWPASCVDQHKDSSFARIEQCEGCSVSIDSIIHFQKCSADIEQSSRMACFCSEKACSSTSPCVFERNNRLSITDEQEIISTPTPSLNCQKMGSKRVRFANVKVYYFARSQGISTVPKSGEVSLGMTDKHFMERQFPLQLGRYPELTLTNGCEARMYDHCSKYSYGIFDSEKRSTACQLQLFEGKTRIKMLKRSGVHVQKDESVESLESIRKSRVQCGCHCENGICLKDTCQCSLEGIVCQVDGPDDFGMTHPCWCSAGSCSNPWGRLEFDPEHVKNHYRVTMMRLKHAEKSGVYNLPQRILFDSDGEPQSVSHTSTSPLKPAYISNEEQVFQPEKSDQPKQKFPVTPVFRKSRHKRGLRVTIAGDRCSAPATRLKTKPSC